MQNTTNRPSQSEATDKPLRSLNWYDYLWAAMPIVLLYTGGALGVAGNVLGGLVGALGVMLNLRILRGQRGAVLRYLLPVLVTIGAFVVFAILITLFQAFTRQH